MSYFMTNEMTTMSPFDEALERQKQPLLLMVATRDNNDEQSPNLRTVTPPRNDHIYSRLTQWLSITTSMLRNILTTTTTNTHPPSDALPFWSTKYREHQNYQNNEEAMIETIEFTMGHEFNSTTTNESKEICNEYEYLYVYDMTYSKDITSTTTWYYIEQNQRRKRIVVSIGIVVIVIVVIIFGSFIFA